MNQDTFRLTIPDPCMQHCNSEGGRHCSSCRKTVIDFTSCSSSEVQSFFLERNMQPVCGRFNAAQLAAIRIQIPSYVLRKPLPLWKKYLVVLLICFSRNLLPPNTIAGFSGAAYGQVQHAYKKAKKHKVKKRKRYVRPYAVEEIDATLMIMGYTATIQEEQAAIKMLLEYPYGNIVPAASPHPLPEKKEPFKENNKERPAFILPSVPPRRRKFKKIK